MLLPSYPVGLSHPEKYEKSKKIHKKTIKKYSIDNFQFPLYDNGIPPEIGEKIFLIS